MSAAPDFYSLFEGKKGFVPNEPPSEPQTPDFYSLFAQEAKQQPLPTETASVPAAAQKDYGYGLRQDKTQKGLGFFGPIPMLDNRVMTELGSEADIDGKHIHFPLIVPTLSKNEIEVLRRGAKPTSQMWSKAIQHAQERIAQGKSPFAEEGEQLPMPGEEKQEKDWSYWVKHSEDPKHPFKRTLKEYPDKFAAALGIGAAAAHENFMRGGRQPFEFEGVEAAPDLFGLFGVEKPFSAAEYSVTDKLRENLYENIQDPQIKDTLESAEILGGFFSLQPIISKGAQAINKIAETVSFVNKVSDQFGVSRADVVKRMWQLAKEKYGWKPKIDPKNGTIIVEPSQLDDMTKLAKKEPEALVGEVLEQPTAPTAPEEKLPEVAPAAKTKPQYNIEYQNYQISNRNQQKQDVEGHIYYVGDSRVLGVRKLEKPDEDGNKYIVDHPNSGLRMAGAETKTEANDIAKWTLSNAITNINKFVAEDPNIVAQGINREKFTQYLSQLKEEKKAKKIKPEPREAQERQVLPAEELEKERAEAAKAVPTPQTDFSNRKLAEQKAFILDKVNDAIENPTNREQVTIKVPDDGVFRVNNNPENLEDFKKRVQKQWPGKPVKAAPQLPATTDFESLTPQQRNEYTKLLTNAIASNTYSAIEGKKIPQTPESAKIYRSLSELSYLNTYDRERFAAIASRIESPEKIKEPKLTTPEKPTTQPLASNPVSKKFNVRPEESKLQRRQPVIGKQQAVARSKIIQHFRDSFKDPIRLGKISQRNAAGIHKLWERVTRLLQGNNVETAAHEIGHNLHTLLYGGDAADPTQQRLNINAALRPYLDELKPLALYEPFGMEGFAEFTRLYVTNANVAQEVAPKFYAKFEADLDAQYPELRNALLEARDYYEQYLQGTPESRIRAQTEYGEDASKLDNLIDWIKSNANLDSLKTQWIDDVFPAKRLVAEAFGIPLTEVENLKDPRNLYRSLRVLKGAIGKADVFLTHQTFDAATLKRKGRGLRQILQKLNTPEEYKEFNDYLIARRTIEKAGQGIETGISYGDAVYTEHKLMPKYKKLAVLLDHYNDALLAYARDGGLLSDEQYGLIRKNNMMYVPFQRVMEKEKGGMASAGGKLQAGKPIKRMKGSTRNIIAPIESVIKNTYSIIVNAEKNLSGQVLAKLADMQGVGTYVERVPTPMELKAKISREAAIEQMTRHFKRTQGIGFEGDIGGAELKIFDDLALTLADAIPDFFLRFGPGTYPAGENIVTVFHNGKPSFFEVSPKIYQMWTKGIAPYTADVITRILRIPARALRAGAILNPKFMAKNVVRDTWGGFLFTKYGKSVKDPVGMFIDTLYAPLAQLCTAARQGNNYVEWMKSGGGMSTMQSLDRNAVTKRLKEVRDGLSPTQVISWLRKIAEISEEANRLAEFSRALTVEGETRLGKEIAAFASRDLSIDFAKMGLQTKALNQIIPFWNATVQGGDKFFRTLASDQDRAEFIARAVVFILVPSLMLAWLNQNDDRAQELQEQEKDFNFITFIGDTALKIPVPFETGVLVHGLTQRLYNHFVKASPHAFEGFMGSIASAMLPNLIPAFANPFVEAEANRNFFTGARIIPTAKQNLIAKYQYKNNTSVTARLVGRAMAYMLGQDTRSKAASPAIIDHFINSWGAGLGRTVVAILDEGLQAAGLGNKVPRPDASIAERFGLDAFVSRYPRASTSSIEKFYDYYADATARQRSIAYAKKQGLEEPEELQEAYERVENLYSYPALKRAYKAMQKSQKAINAIWLSPDIDAKTKRIMIDEIYLQQIVFTKEVLKDIESYRSKK